MSKPCEIELLIATSNRGKIREIRQALSDLPLTLLTLNDFDGVKLVEETGETYEQNATLKAVQYALQTGRPTIADDSGLEVELLGGLPGVRSARFGGSDAAGVDKLLSILANFETAERRARFVSCIVIADAPVTNGKAPKILTVKFGECRGRLAPEARGRNGFGYDPVFMPDGYEQTFGELSDEIKNRISHRATALARIKEFLQQWWGMLDRCSNGS